MENGESIIKTILEDVKNGTSHSVNNEKLIGKCKYVQKPVTTNTEVFDILSDIIYKDKDDQSYKLANYVPGIKRRNILE